MGLDINLQTSKIDISEEDGINVDLYTDKLDIEESEAEDIIIEITGLKSINKFIGLEDTPIYYENGKFFKVQDNKIIYTDIEWKDITGDIQDAPELIDIIENTAEQISQQLIDNAIITHDNNSNAHQYIQNIINDNYETLNTEINKKVETIMGSDFIDITRDGSTVIINSKTFIFEQAIAADTWVINYDLTKKKPTVDVIDSSGSVQVPNEIEYTTNTIKLYFLAAFTGKAYLN